MIKKPKNTISFKESFKQDFPELFIIIQVFYLFGLALIPLFLLYAPYMIIKTMIIRDYNIDARKATRLSHIWVTVGYVFACIVSETVRLYVLHILGIYVTLFQIFFCQ